MASFFKFIDCVYCINSFNLEGLELRLKANINDLEFLNISYTINGDNTTLLMYACRRPSIEAVKLLLKYKADPNAIPYNRSRTPLYIAATYMDCDMVKTLLLAGADPNMTHNKKSRHTPTVVHVCVPLIWAVENNWVSGVKLLLEHGANINICDVFNDTPLASAAKYAYNNKEMIDLLIAEKVDINNTAMHRHDILLGMIVRDRKVLLQTLIRSGYDIFRHDLNAIVMSTEFWESFNNKTIDAFKYLSEGRIVDDRNFYVNSYNKTHYEKYLEGLKIIMPKILLFLDITNIIMSFGYTSLKIQSYAKN